MSSLRISGISHNPGDQIYGLTFKFSNQEVSPPATSYSPAIILNHYDIREPITTLEFGKDLEGFLMSVRASRDDCSSIVYIKGSEIDQYPVSRTQVVHLKKGELIVSADVETTGSK